MRYLASDTLHLASDMLHDTLHTSTEYIDRIVRSTFNEWHRISLGLRCSPKVAVNGLICTICWPCVAFHLSPDITLVKALMFFLVYYWG